MGDKTKKLKNKYKSDKDAAANGVKINEYYLLAEENDYLLIIEGEFLKKRVY